MIDIDDNDTICLFVMIRFTRLLTLNTSIKIKIFEQLNKVNLRYEISIIIFSMI